MKWKIEHILAALIIGFLAWLFFLKKTSSTMKSFLGDSSLPRGIRNNNPGNLRLTSIPWQGKVPNSQNTDGAFEQFFEFRFGIRAMILDIRNDMIRDGLNTLRAILYEYAPPNENNTEGYVSTVSNMTGFQPDQILSSDKETLRKLVQSFSIVENGRDEITNLDFNQAWDLL